MAYFAHIDDEGTVLQVISISNSIAVDPAPLVSEPLGQAFIASLGIEGEWKQTSYNGNFRKRYAGIGYKYLKDDDVFIAPQPYPSWTMDENYDWQPPIPEPKEGLYSWDEESGQWIQIV